MRRGFPGPFTVVLVLTMLFGVLACTQPPAPAAPAAGGAGGAAAPAPSGPAIELKVTMYQTPTHLYVNVFKKWFPLIEKATAGRVKATIYDSETLAKANEFLDATNRGVADVAFAFPPYNSATFPLFDETYLPFSYRDYRGQLDTYVNGMEELYLEELKSKGLDKIASFGVMSSGARYLLTKKPVKAPSDLKGMKLRAAGSLESRMIEIAGGSGVSTVASEVYEAIQRGIIDGAMAVHTNIVDWKWMEVAPNMLNMPVGYIPMWLIYNTDSMNKVSASDRATVDAIFRLSLRALGEESMATEHYRVANVMPPKMTYNTPSPEQMTQWQDTFKPLLDEFKQKTGERGAKALEIKAKYNQR